MTKIFEEIKHIDEDAVEYWYAIESMPVLQYAKWENFKKVIEKAMVAAKIAKFQKVLFY